MIGGLVEVFRDNCGIMKDLFDRWRGGEEFLMRIRCLNHHFFTIVVMVM